MNYIETNVINQYCRNYLKAVVCVTIYPPRDNGIQKMCPEECDNLLNIGTCSFDTKHFTEYVIDVMSNSSITLTINCSNSLDFSNRFSNKTSNQSSNCISLIEIAEIPPR